MLGRYHPVRADVVSVDLSTHADRSELVDWVRAAGKPHLVLVNHGEENAAAALADVVGRELGLSAVVPRAGERIRLDRPA
jgi:metallo-beta-lactamase family protein